MHFPARCQLLSVRLLGRMSRLKYFRNCTLKLCTNAELPKFTELRKYPKSAKTFKQRHLNSHLNFLSTELELVEE